MVKKCICDLFKWESFRWFSISGVDLVLMASYYGDYESILLRSHV